MRFPNAQKGVSRIYRAEIIALIASVLMVVSGVILIVEATLDADSDAAGAVGTISLVVLIMSLIAMIVAFFIELAGIISAKKDEGSFNIALICVMIGIVASVVSTIFADNDVVQDVTEIFSRVANIGVTVFIIQGICNLSVRLKDQAMLEKGNKVMYAIVIVQVLSLIAIIIGTIFHSKGGLMTTGIIAIIAGIIDIVAYFMYLSYLSKARRMLEA